MNQIQTNPRPSYHAIRHHSTTGRLMTNWVNILEVQGAESNHICTVQIGPKLLEQLTKRGIPTEDAQRLVEQLRPA